MESRKKFLNAVKYVGGSVLTIGVIMFLFGFSENDYSIFTSLGIGTVMGAVFIFLMGVFFVATEEMLEKTQKGVKIVSISAKKRSAVLRRF